MLLLCVVKGGGPNVMGRDSLGKFKVNPGEVHTLVVDEVNQAE